MATNLSLEFLHNVLEKVLVKVLSSQKCISIGGLHFKNSLLNLQDRDIKCATSKIIDYNAAMKDLCEAFIHPPKKSQNAIYGVLNLYLKNERISCYTVLLMQVSTAVPVIQ